MMLIVLALSVAIIWGINAILNKLIFDNGIDTITCFAISSIMYFVLAIAVFIGYSNINSLKIINKKGWILLTTYSLLSIIAYIIYLYCIKVTNDINIIITITCISPIITLLLTNVFNMSSINIIQIVGVCLATVGVCLVAMYSN